MVHVIFSTIAICIILIMRVVKPIYIYIERERVDGGGLYSILILFAAKNIINK